jgi:Flp pilus assembly protein protease CpaA
MINILCILMDAFFISVLAWCSYTDIRKRSVSNIAVILLLSLGLTHTALMGLSGSTWWTYPAGLALAVPFLIVWLKGSMGAGDVKLLMGICLYLGVLNTLIAFVLMIPAMAVFCVRSWIRNKTLKQRIPFAPVLAVGAIGATAAGYVYALVNI